MRYVITLVFAIVGLAWVSTIIGNHDGIVSFVFANGTYKLNVSVFIVFLCILIFIIMLVIWLIMFVCKIPKNWSLLRQRNRAKKAHKLLQLGMIAIGNGQYKDAERLLVKGAKINMNSGTDSGIYWTNAALSAQKQNKLDKRDEYLLEARKLEADNHNTETNLFSEASLYLDSGEHQHAIDLLDKKSHLSYNPHFMSIKYRAHVASKDYGKAWETLMSMGKTLSKEDFNNRKRVIAKEIFADNTYDFSLDKQVWSALPKDMKGETEIILYYVSALIENGEPAEAENILSKAIKVDYADPLIHAYGQLEFGSNLDKLKKVEAWLKYKPENPYMNYAAANFSYQLDKLDAAKKYAENSVKQLVMPETLALLGKIYEKLGDTKSALAAYRQTVALTYDATNKDKVADGAVLALGIASDKVVNNIADESVANNSANESVESANKSATAVDTKAK